MKIKIKNIIYENKNDTLPQLLTATTKQISNENNANAGPCNAKQSRLPHSHSAIDFLCKLWANPHTPITLKTATIT